MQNTTPMNQRSTLKSSLKIDHGRSKNVRSNTSTRIFSNLNEINSFGMNKIKSNQKLNFSHFYR